VGLSLVNASHLLSMPVNVFMRSQSQLKLCYWHILKTPHNRIFSAKNGIVKNINILSIKIIAVQHKKFNSLLIYCLIVFELLDVVIHKLDLKKNYFALLRHYWKSV